MKSGKLDKRIEVQRKGETITPAGSVIEAWSLLIRLRAEVLQQSATEFLREPGEAERTAIVFRVRWPSTEITLGDRILHRATAYDLVEIKEVGRKRGLELRCEAVK